MTKEKKIIKIGLSSFFKFLLVIKIAMNETDEYFQSAAINFVRIGSSIEKLKENKLSRLRKMCFEK